MTSTPQVVTRKIHKVFRVHDGRMVFSGRKEDAVRKFRQLGGTKGGYRLMETTAERLKDAMRRPQVISNTITQMEQTYSIDEVKKMAQEKGVSTTGSKRDIIRRMAG